MSFDSIPENKEESFPCDILYCRGNVTYVDGIWTCDSCGEIYGE